MFEKFNKHQFQIFFYIYAAIFYFISSLNSISFHESFLHPRYVCVWRGETRDSLRGSNLASVWIQPAATIQQLRKHVSQIFSFKLSRHIIQLICFVHQTNKIVIVISLLCSIYIFFNGKNKFSLHEIRSFTNI